MNKQGWRASCAHAAGMLCVATMVGTVCASPDVPLSEEEFLGELPVVLSVSRLSQPMSEAPSAVTIIDREMIRTSGARELPDLLRLVPGFYTGFYRGNEPVISHGITGRLYGRIQVLVDGRSVYTPLFGQVPWTSIPLHMEDIERIEVTRGPNAASYGANSFVAAINIITRHAREDQGVAGLARAGNDDIADGMVRYGGRNGDLDYRLTVASQADRGLPDLHDSKRIKMFSGRGDYRINGTDSLQVQLGYSHGDQGQGFSDNNLDPPHEQHLSNSFAQVKWQRILGVDDEVSLQFYHTDTKSKENVTIVPSGLVLPTSYSLNTQAERYEIEFQRNQALHPEVRVVWGASARLDRIYAPIYLGRQEKFDTDLYRLFANVEWRARPSLLINVGAMAERNSVTGSEISPRGAISYHFAPGQTVRLGASSATRTPTILENSANYYVTLPIVGSGTVSFPYYFGPGNLKAEHIQSHEIGYRGEWPRLGLDVDVRVYHERIRDIINITPYTQNFSLGPGGVVFYDQRYYIYGNLGRVDVDGVETQIGWKGQHSRVWLTHAYRHVTSPTPDYVEATPVHIYGLLGSHRFPFGVEASAGFYHVGGMTPIGDGSVMQGYNRVDLRVAKQMKWGGANTEVALMGQNISGRYLDYNRQNKIDQRLWMTVRMGF